MIKLKATLKGIPFEITINGKQVIYEGFDENYKKIKEQWFPPITKKVLANLDKEEYAQWQMAKNEEEVFKIIKFDLIRNGCQFKEERINGG